VAIAAPGDLLFRLTAPDPQSGAFFGDMVESIDGNILISEPSRRYLAIDAPGRAYLFDGSTAQLKWTFENPDPMDQDRFAPAITGGDGRIFISTIGLVERVYAFDVMSGAAVATIANPVPNNNFGTGLEYGDGHLLVSAPGFSIPGSNAVGRAYLFEAGTGQLNRPIPNPEPKAGDGFGSGISLAIVGDRAIVGAMGDDLPEDTQPDGDNPGRVWVFDRATGQSRFTFENPNANNQLAPFFLSDRFGRSVAAGANLIAVGAVEDSSSGVAQSGTVYVFDIETGALRHTLFSPQLEAGGGFGRSLAVTAEGDVLVGAWSTSVNGIDDAGHVYLFDGESGNLVLDIPHPEPTRGDGFGWSVAAGGGRILVGAPNGDAEQLAGTGAVTHSRRFRNLARSPWVDH
jgi:outer membrane protein assembly factor BamB